MTCRLPCGIGVGFVVIYVGDVLHDPVVLKTDGRLSVVSGHGAGGRGGGVVNERGDGVLTKKMMRSFADDAVWTRGVRKGEPRSSKMQNDARACARNAVKRVSKGTRRTCETIEDIKEMALGVLYSILFPERMGTQRRPKNGPVLPVVTTGCRRRVAAGPLSSFKFKRQARQVQVWYAVIHFSRDRIRDNLKKIDVIPRSDLTYKTEIGQVGGRQ